MKDIFRLIKYIPSGGELFAFSCFLITIEGILSTLSPIFLRNLTNTVFAGRVDANHWHQVAMPLALIAATSIAAAILDAIATLTSSRLERLLGTKLRISIFERLSALSIDYFEQVRIGEVIQKVTTATSELLSWLIQASNFLFVQTIIFFTALVILATVDWQIALIMTVASAINFYFQSKLIKRNREEYRQSRAISEQALGIGTESLSQIMTIRSFGQEKPRLGRMEVLLNKVIGIEWTIAKRTELSFLWRALMLVGARIVCLALIIVAIFAHHHSPGDLVLVALYLQQIVNNLGPVGRFFVATGQTQASAARITEVLDQRPTVLDAVDARELTHLDTIEFVDVSFSYPGKKRKILEDVSFKLKPGTTTALIGPSGAGKTTVTKLLQRFYEPSRGSILINGEPIAAFTQDSVRRQIGMVMQDVALFNESVEDNLMFARPDASRAEIKEAARLAYADIFIERLPEKYKTMVGERGIKLSGGEKQRIAITRAILRQPSVIVLDEATSALDSESEHYVQEGLQHLMTGRTAIIIAHRLSTVMKADQILVFQDGRIIERGDHSTLMNRKTGLYSRLFKLQTNGTLQ